MFKSNTGERVIPGQSPPNVVEEHIERYTFAARRVAGQMVLDLACGSGYGSAMLAHAGAKYVVGADIDTDVVKYAQGQYSQVENCSFLLTDGLHLPALDRSFEVVVCYETIEHVPRPELILEGFKAALKPKGTLVISTPNSRLTRFPYGWSRALAGKPYNPFHHREYAPAEFYGLVEDHFNIEYVGGQRFLHYAKLAHLAAIHLVFPNLRRRVVEEFYSALSRSSAKVTPTLRCRVPYFAVLICRPRS